MRFYECFKGFHTLTTMGKCTSRPLFQQGELMEPYLLGTGFHQVQATRDDKSPGLVARTNQGDLSYRVNYRPIFVKKSNARTEFWFLRVFSRIQTALN